MLLTLFLFFIITTIAIILVYIIVTVAIAFIDIFDDVAAVQIIIMRIFITIIILIVKFTYRSQFIVFSPSCPPPLYPIVLHWGKGLQRKDLSVSILVLTRKVIIRTHTHTKHTYLLCLRSL